MRMCLFYLGETTVGGPLRKLLARSHKFKAELLNLSCASPASIQHLMAPSDAHHPCGRRGTFGRTTHNQTSTCSKPALHKGCSSRPLSSLKLCCRCRQARLLFRTLPPAHPADAERDLCHWPRRRSREQLAAVPVASEIFPSTRRLPVPSSAP